MEHKTKFITVLILLTLQAMLFSQNGKMKVSDAMAKLDAIMEQQEDITANVTFIQKKPKQGTKKYRSIYYRRDSDDSFVIIMVEPENEKGNGYLRVGDNFWMYRRNTRTFQHINRDESISGTDVRGGDMEEKKLEEQYKPGHEYVIETTLGKNNLPVYKFTLEAKTKDVTYPKQIYWVERDTLLPRKVESYSLSGTLMNTSIYYKYTKIKERYIMILAKFIDEFEKGNVTVLKLEGISLKDIDDSIFTKAFLENASK